MIDLTFKHTAGTREFSTRVSMAEYLQIIQSGLLDGKPLAYIKIWSLEYDDAPSDWLVYDFVKAGTGQSGFRTMQELNK